MIGYTFSPSVVENLESPGRYDVGCKVTYTNEEGVEQFIENRVWLTSIADYDMAAAFAHQTVKFMLSYYEKMISSLVERMIRNESISGFDTASITSKPLEYPENSVLRSSIRESAHNIMESENDRYTGTGKDMAYTSTGSNSEG